MSRRTAAALMITRGQGRDLTVYLAERAAQLRFFGGYWAMPGGTIATEDLAANATTGNAAVDEANALQVCADRELFEELGLMLRQLPDGRGEPAALKPHRTALLDHEARMAKKKGDGKDKPISPWPSIIANTNPPDALRSLCRIETPAFAPVRYDTVFFHVPVEQCASGTGVDEAGDLAPDIWPGELTDGRFWSPQNALAAWRKGELLLVPPVVILLEHLAAANDFEQFAREIETTTVGYRNGDLHKVRFSPGIVLAPLRTPTLPPATTTNCYIVGHEELWIVDPGSPDPMEQQRLLNLLDELTSSGQQLKGVLLTHHHPDHVGGVLALCRARELKAFGHPHTLDRIDEHIPRGDAIADGGRIALGTSPDGKPGWELEAIFTPGHDQGHLCFRESRYGAMLAGDMMSTISTIIIDPPEGHLATYLASLDRISQLEMTTLYPAHGPAVRNGQRVVQKYIRHRRQREATLLKVLGEVPGTIDELLPKVYWDADPRLFPFAVRSLLAGLQKLEEEGRAQNDGGNWRLAAEQSPEQ
ncbi:MAG: ribonuclease/clavin/mitogillin [Planctomycetota bacterium]|jgi:ribonuclease/clavin/mitogillin